MFSFWISDDSIVVSAPTGSGKTALFELAMVRLLMQNKELGGEKFKIVYSMFACDVRIIKRVSKIKMRAQ